MNEAIRMQLSAFVDGELPENEKELLLRRLSQDAELRRQVSEFFTIGRAMRGELQVDGLERLRERIAAGIGGEQIESVDVGSEPGEKRLLRPLAGLAIAATVAFFAVFGLQQLQGVEEVVPRGGPSTAYTEPGADDYMRELRRSHGATALELGANSIKARWTSLPTGSEVLGEEITEDDSDDETDDNVDDVTAE